MPDIWRSDDSGVVRRHQIPASWIGAMGAENLVAGMMAIKGTLDANSFGAMPTTGDAATAMNAALAKGALQDRTVFVGPGDYHMRSGLAQLSAYPKIIGVPGKTRFIFHGNTYDWLTLGTGSGASQGPAGLVYGLSLLENDGGTAPSGSNAGIKMNAVQFTGMVCNRVANAAVGIDMVGNNFGSWFFNNRTQFDECRVGILLRGTGGGPTFGSGNDIPFYQNWFGGRDAAVWIEGDGGGYHFHGGQLNGGANAPSLDDTRGVVIMGKYFTSGLAGGLSSATFSGVSWESATYAWAIRAFGTGAGGSGVRALMHGCNFRGDSSGSPGIGVLKISSGYDDTITFIDCSVNGAWSNASPVSLGTATSNANPVYYEIGTKGNATFNGSTTINGAVNGLNLNGMLWTSDLSGSRQGVNYQGRFHWIHNGMAFKRSDETSGAVLQFSCNGNGFANV